MAINKRIIKSNDEAAAGASFNTVLYTGNGSTQSITGVGFQPDLIWTKSRSISQNHVLATSVQGVGKGLISNLTIAEFNDASTVTSFDSDGFSIGGNASMNTNGATMVAWCWKAGGAAVTNTDGTITSQVSANTEAGFSVVSYTGGTGVFETGGHGLNATPKVIILKRRDDAENWLVYTSVIDGSWDFLRLNTTDAKGDSSANLPTDSVFSIGGNDGDYIAYCFAEVAGFSKFSSYTGTGASGNAIVTGFDPAFVILKGSSPVGSSWIMIDNKRGDSYLKADTSDSEVSSDIIDFTANGFVFKGSNMNTSSREYIYMAFANQF